MTHTITAEDALKYAAARLTACTDWATDAIGGSMCSETLDHETELDAINETVAEIAGLAARFGDPRRYSDGRLIRSCAEIDTGLATAHVWHPDASAEQPQSWRGTLPSDPGVPSPGVYEVELDPTTQHILVRVVRSA